MKIETRVEKLKEKYQMKFEMPAEDIFVSPGRIELLGNHTDHNNGKVLVSSVNLNIVAAVGRRNDDKVVFYSKGYPRMEIGLNRLGVKTNEFGNSKALVRGVLFKMKQLGYKIGGFNVCCDSNVPNGAGVSSSAAFEVLVAKILSVYYNEDKIEAFELAKIAQYSETIYFNKPCGLLDQTGIALGGINYVDFKNTEKPVIRNLKTDIKGYQFILINTGDDHTKLTPYYAAIKDDMKAVANYFGHNVLREVNEDVFTQYEAKVKDALGERAYLRAKHYFEENNRVEKAYTALEQGKVKVFLQMLDESGQSSYSQLKNCYVESENENLPQALNWVRKNFPDSYSRVHGGGFAGTMLLVVKKKNINQVIIQLRERFGSNNVMKVALSSEGSCKL